MHRRGPPQARARYELHRVHRKCGNIVENGAIVGSGDCASLYFAASERNAAPFPNLCNHPRLASFLSLFPDCRLVAFHTIRRPAALPSRWPAGHSPASALLSSEPIRASCALRANSLGHAATPREVAARTLAFPSTLEGHPRSGVG